jgi:hypothetical protein
MGEHMRRRRAQVSRLQEIRRQASRTIVLASEDDEKFVRTFYLMCRDEFSF